MTMTESATTPDVPENADDASESAVETAVVPAEPEEQEHPVTQFVKDHPVLTIAGGLAIGVVAAALFPKGNRRFVAEKTSALAGALSAASVALYREAAERAEAAGESVRDMAGSASRNVRDMAGQIIPGKKTTVIDEAKHKAEAAGSDLADAFAALARYLRGK
jgi:outer membrane lipoprotein SlyB